MKIEKIDIYRDGGTVSIQTDIGTYYIDNRAPDRDRNPTKGMLFIGYPGKSDPLPLSEAKELKKKFKSALKEFGVQSLNYEKYLPLIESIKTTERKKY